ncbi:hypothetical protein RCG21_31060, partial [Bacillus salipaludis]|nr:hypothetical protein [Bacillus salipaludis]
LKERREDIPFFLQYFICKYCSILNRPYMTVNRQLEKWLIQYDWPGNIPAGIKERCGVYGEYGGMRCDWFSRLFRLFVPIKAPIQTGGLSLDEMVAEYEKSIIQSFFYEWSWPK